MSGRWHPRAAAVAWAWAGFNAVLAGVLVAFAGPTVVWRMAMYWSAVAIVVLVGLVALRRPPARRSPASGTGAPSMAFALACLAGGLAWVFGVYLAYFVVPLLAFCVGRWRLERKVAGR